MHLYICQWYPKTDPSVWPVWICFLHVDRFWLSWLSLNSGGITSHQHTLERKDIWKFIKSPRSTKWWTVWNNKKLICAADVTTSHNATEHTEWRAKWGCSHANAQQEAELMIHPMIFAVHKHLGNRSCNTDHRKNQDPELPKPSMWRVLFLNELLVSSIWLYLFFALFRKPPSETTKDLGGCGQCFLPMDEESFCRWCRQDFLCQHNGAFSKSLLWSFKSCKRFFWKHVTYVTCAYIFHHFSLFSQSHFLLTLNGLQNAGGDKHKGPRLRQKCWIHGVIFSYRAFDTWIQIVGGFV